MCSGHECQTISLLTQFSASQCRRSFLRCKPPDLACSAEHSRSSRKKTSEPLHWARSLSSAGQKSPISHLERVDSIRPNQLMELTDSAFHSVFCHWRSVVWSNAAQLYFRIDLGSVFFIKGLKANALSISARSKAALVELSSRTLLPF